VNNQLTHLYASLASNYDIEPTKNECSKLLVLKYQRVHVIIVCLPAMLSRFPKVWNIRIWSFSKTPRLV